MKSLDIITRILDLCNDRGISVNKMLIDTGINTNLITNMRNRGTIPSAETIQTISTYLEVPSKFLICENPFDKWEYLQNRKTMINLLGYGRRPDALNYINSISLSEYICFLDSILDSVITTDDGDMKFVLRKDSKYFYFFTLEDDNKNKPTVETDNELIKLLNDPTNKAIFEKLSKLSEENLDLAAAQIDLLLARQEKQEKK